MKASGEITSNIFPSLTYDDAPAAIEWLCRVFGFRQRLVVPGEDGTIVHSELSLGPGVIMVSSAKPEQDRVSRRGQRGNNFALSVRIDDPDAHYRQAKTAGAEIIRELRDEDFGARGYMAEDLEGYHWYFADYQPGAHWEV